MTAASTTAVMISPDSLHASMNNKSARRSAVAADLYLLATPKGCLPCMTSHLLRPSKAGMADCVQPHHVSMGEARCRAQTAAWQTTSWLIHPALVITRPVSDRLEGLWGQHLCTSDHASQPSFFGAATSIRAAAYSLLVMLGLWPTQSIRHSWSGSSLIFWVASWQASGMAEPGRAVVVAAGRWGCSSLHTHATCLSFRALPMLTEHGAG